MDRLRDLFRTRAALGRAWGEHAGRTPLLLAPIFTDRPFAPDADLAGPDTARAIVRGLRYTLAVNLLGLPAVAVPTGLVDGRPQAVQIIGPRWAEAACLDAAAVIEAAVDAAGGRSRAIDPVVAIAGPTAPTAG